MKSLLKNKLGQLIVRSNKLKFRLCPIRLLATTTKMAAHNIYQDAEVVQFLHNSHYQMVKEALIEGTDLKTKVVNFEQPVDLEKKLDLCIGEDGESHSKLLDLCKDIVHYSVKTGHCRFYNQLYSGVDPYALVGAWLTDTLNTNLHTFEVAPVFVVLEKYLIEKLCTKVGFQNGDGVFVPGGNFSIFMGIHMARYKAAPDVKTEGMFGHKPMVIYTSDQAHYSTRTGASFLGLGSNNVVEVKTDETGKMIPEDLENKIKDTLEQNKMPLMVTATCGTTVLGAYDPLTEIVDICKKYGVWVHADACLGGGVVLSSRHRKLMRGIEKCDSVSLNLHKMGGSILQTTIFLLDDKGLLKKSNVTGAEYLYQKDKLYSVEFDLGDKTVQCGRKVDVLKLWLMWKAYGDKGMEEKVNKQFENTSYLTKKLSKKEGFRLVMPTFECTNVGFWYIPPSLRGQEETEEWWEKLSKVAPKIKERMQRQGTMMIGFTPLTTKGLVNFFRIVIRNPMSDHSDMDFVLQEIDRLGKNL